MQTVRIPNLFHSYTQTLFIKFILPLRLDWYTLMRQDFISSTHAELVLQSMRLMLSRNQQTVGVLVYYRFECGFVEV